jgi:predicted nucleotidyltransferase
MKTIERIFGSRVRAKVLGWFFMHTDESFFVRQLGTILQEDPTNLSRELSRLEQIGILSSARQANLKLFSVNKRNPLFGELRGLILKTIGVHGRLRSALEDISGIRYAFIYGSFARAEETLDSDVDLMIIGDVDLEQIDARIGEVEKELGRTINYIAYDLKEFADKKRRADGFLVDVLRDKKIMLRGDERELEKTRVARSD